MWVPDPPDDPILMLGRLGRQNPSLRTGGWHVYPVHGDSQGESSYGRALAFGLDVECVRALRALDIRTFLAVGRVTFKLTGAQEMHD